MNYLFDKTFLHLLSSEIFIKLLITKINRNEFKIFKNYKKVTNFFLFSTIFQKGNIKIFTNILAEPKNNIVEV